MSDDYIFVRPGFMRGVARVMDIGGSLGRGSFLLSPTPEEADARAIASDFAAVGRDIAAATEQLEQQVRTKAGAR